MKFGGKVILGVLFFLVGLTVVFATTSSSSAHLYSSNKIIMKPIYFNNIATWVSHNATTDNPIYSVAVSDVDGDGKKDIVAGLGGQTDRISVYTNNGAAFSKWSSSNVTTPDNAYTVAVSDVDGDGKKDIVAGLGGQTDRISVYTNNGAAFSKWSSSNVTTADDVYSVTISDVDGDGKNDIVAGMGFFSPMVSVFTNNGKSFDQWSNDSSYPFDDVNAVAVSDIDNDGKNDVISAIGVKPGEGSIIVYSNSGGAFVNWPNDSASTADVASSVAIGDVDGDGKNDIVTGLVVNGNTVSLYTNNGKSFNQWSSSNVTTADRPLSVAIGDVDGDGKNDIVVGVGSDGITGGRVSIYYNNGKSFNQWSSSNVTTSYDVNSVAVQDIDNDGDKDIIAGTGLFFSGKITVYVNPVKQPVKRYKIYMGSTKSLAPLAQ